MKEHDPWMRDVYGSPVHKPPKDRPHVVIQFFYKVSLAYAFGWLFGACTADPHSDLGWITRWGQACTVVFIVLVTIVRAVTPWKREETEKWTRVE